MKHLIFCEGSALLGTSFLLDLIGDLAGAGANLIGSFVNAHTQNRNTDKAIAAQKEENERAYQRNIEQWNRENVYNSPSEVIKRLQAAGLNPNLAYGTPNVSAPSPSAPINDVSSIANKRSPVGAALEEGVNARYMNALISNMNADTKEKEASAQKTGAESDYQLTYNKYAEQILTGTISEQKSRIELNASQTDLNDMRSRESYTNISNILATTNKIKTEIDVLETQMQGMKEDNAIKRIEKEMRRGVLSAQMSHLYAQAKLANATAAKTQEEFNQLSAAAIYNLVAKKEMANNEYLKGLTFQNESELLSVQIDAASYDLSRKKSNEFIDDLNKVVGTFGNVIETVSSCFDVGFKSRAWSR